MPDISSMFAGNSATWAKGVGMPRPIGDLRPHVDGGPGVKRSDHGYTTQQSSSMFISAGLVFAAIAILWVLGGISFKSIRF